MLIEIKSDIWQARERERKSVSYIFLITNTFMKQPHTIATIYAKFEIFYLKEEKATKNDVKSTLENYFMQIFLHIEKKLINSSSSSSSSCSLFFFYFIFIITEIFNFFLQFNLKKRTILFRIDFLIF